MNQIRETYKHIQERAKEIHKFIKEKGLNCLSFEYSELLCYDYFYLNEDFYMNKTYLSFVEIYRDSSDEVSHIPIQLFESDDWKAILIEDNEVGKQRKLQVSEAVKEQAKKREYNEYLKLKEKFEGK